MHTSARGCARSPRSWSERRPFGIVNDVTAAGHVVKEKDGRRNRYRVQHDLPLRLRVPGEPSIGDLLGVLVDTVATEPARIAGGDGASRWPKSRGQRTSTPGKLG